MVFVGDISIVYGLFKPTYNWAPPCREHWMNMGGFRGLHGLSGVEEYQKWNWTQHISPQHAISRINTYQTSIDADTRDSRTF